jgi:hypothetical protein
MFRIKFSVLLVFVLFFLAGFSLGEDKPDFSGKWELNIQKSDFGALPAPYEVILMIDHKDPRLKLEIHQSTMQGDIDASFVLTTDGEKSSYPVGEADVVTIAIWKGDTLHMDSDLAVQGLNIDYQDIWTLSKDGSQFTIERDMSSEMGETSQILIFEKK